MKFVKMRIQAPNCLKNFKIEYLSQIESLSLQSKYEFVESVKITSQRVEYPAAKQQKII